MKIAKKKYLAHFTPIEVLPPACDKVNDNFKQFKIQ